MTYQELINTILQLQEEGLEIFSVGKSVLGKDILATHLGDYSGVQIVIQSAIHAREYITALLAVELARNLHNNDLVHDGGIYIIFITDPDGVEIVLDGIDTVDCEITRNYLINGNNGSTDFSQYKANINQVDLNTNFDASWGGGSQNVFCPNSENFIGFYPNSEREVQSLINFTLRNKPLLTISYHSKGNVIYYGFENQSQKDIDRDRQIGEALSGVTGYPIIFTENSTGGYKDWCIDKLKIPAYTIEVGDENLPHPIGVENLPEIYARNKDVPLVALEKAKEFANQIDFMTPIVQNNNKEVKHESNEKGYISRIQSRFARRNTDRSSDSKRQ
ncbi:MAG: hypothetical protein E7351_00505 [Clostridiales bacterium]|nr:hypothetical protein [Clostridiales bacterium]